VSVVSRQGDAPTRIVIARVDRIVRLSGELERPVAQQRRPRPVAQRGDQGRRPEVLMDVDVQRSPPVL